MKNALLFGVFALYCLEAEAPAEPAKFRPSGFEASSVGEAGCSWFEIVDPTEGSTTKTCGVHLAVRARHSRTPFGIEAGMILPHGLGATLILDVYRGDRFRIHAFDVGAFVPVFGRALSVTRIERSWDLTIGAGAEILVRPRVAVTVDWRIFLPNPSEILPIYGDFARLLYDEAGHGGQLWIGVAWYR